MCITWSLTQKKKVITTNITNCHNKIPRKHGLSIAILNPEAAIRGGGGGSFQKVPFSPSLLLPNNPFICTQFLCILSECTLQFQIDCILCQNCKIPDFVITLFSFSASIMRAVQALLIDIATHQQVVQQLSQN